MNGSGTFHAYADQTWYLASEITCWPGLMPHIHGATILDRRDNRTLARINARYGWLPITLECGFQHDEERMVMHRWYRGLFFGGIVERWQVRETDDDLVELSFTLQASGFGKGILGRAVVGWFARRQFEMIDLLAVAHREAQDSDGW